MPCNAVAGQRVYGMGRQADVLPRKAFMIRRRSLPVAGLLLCAACGGTSARTSEASLPNAAQLVERHVAAVGGRERLEAIHSLQIIGILNERGTLHPMFIDRRRPNFLRVRMMHGGELVFTEGYTGSRSWEGPPEKEECAPGPAAAAATRHAAEQFDDPLIAARRTGAALRVVGREALGGRLAYRVDVTHVDGTAGSYYVDTETFLLVRARNRRALHPGQAERVIEVVYDDFRPVSGVLYPFRSLERDFADGEPLTVMRVDWMEANVPLGDNAFALPPRCR
jgi:hypothetical protein